MNEALVAGRYTKALFNLAQQQNVLEQVKKDMEYLYEVYRTVKPFQVLLENPVLKPTQKFQLFKDAFSQINPLTLSTVELIFKNRREEILPFVAMDYIEKYYSTKNIAKVVVKTATPISSTTLQKIEKFLSDQLRNEIIINTEEDPSLLGGFVLRISDKEVDASVRRRLKILEQKLIQTQIK
ncbi:MAG: ATP synthase F1 subunit delta [Bacteroidales bacterium]|nr:ATP synthase F1 subunit delta [Bacteroidales bacterium]